MTEGPGKGKPDRCRSDGAPEPSTRVGRRSGWAGPVTNTPRPTVGSCRVAGFLRSRWNWARQRHNGKARHGPKSSTGPGGRAKPGRGATGGSSSPSSSRPAHGVPNCRPTAGPVARFRPPKSARQPRVDAI